MKTGPLLATAPEAQAARLTVTSACFAGTGRCLDRVRLWTAGRLTSSGRTEAAGADVLTVVNELAANALRHSASGRPGGGFAVTLTWDASAVRVAVTDQGGPTLPEVKPPDFEAESGRGLLLAEGLADRFGWTKTAFGCEVWAEFRIPAVRGAKAEVGG